MSLSSLMTFLFLGLSTQVYGGMWDLGIQAKMGFLSPAEDYIHSSITPGLGMILSPKDNISVSLELGFWKSSVDSEPQKFYEGQMTLMPVLSSLRYSFLPHKTMNPYVFIGTGYVFAQFRMEDIITIPEITINQTVENGFCVLAGVGTVIRISESLGINAEGLYFNRKTTGVTTISDLNFGRTSEEFSARLNAFIFRIGIEYIFD